MSQVRVEPVEHARLAHGGALVGCKPHELLRSLPALEEPLRSRSAASVCALRPRRRARTERLVMQQRHDSARRAAARCRELYADQGGSLPPIRGLDDAAITLTAREAQLVELASRGLSNAEIADRLVLSVRTVESHIYRAMQKLGVGDRRRLRVR